MTKIQYTLEKYTHFRFDAGSLSLNFAATLRHRGSQSRDLLNAPNMLDQWLQLADLPTNGAASTEAEYQEALRLREAIYQTVAALVKHEHRSDEAIHLINKWAALPQATPQLHTDSYSLHWVSEQPIRACLAALARDAVLLMGTTDHQRFKTCLHADCQMLFVDLSPQNKRRWCSMSVCGNREKVAAHRQRQHQHTTSTEDHS